MIYILFVVGSGCGRSGSTKILDTGKCVDLKMSSEPGFVPTRHDSLSRPDWGSVNPYHFAEI